VFSLIRSQPVFQVRPRVHVHGVAALRPMLNGYEEEIVRQALLQSGAAQVTFAA
jgi:hypothetical protein